MLFERTSRRVRLAPAGELLLPRAGSVLAELATAGSELSALSGLLAGRLRIGMISSAGPAASVVEHALATFHRRPPAVEIALRDAGSHLMAEQVRAGELDLAFGGLFADQVPDDLVHTVLAVERLVAAVPPGHHLTDRTSVTLDDLAAGTAFVEMRPESGLRRQVDAAFERAGVTRRIAFELATSESVVRFVGLGFGAALVPRSTARLAIPLDDPAARHPTSVVHRPRPSARELLRLISERSRPAGA